jgi:PAS domain S-box-containing protein
MTESEKGQVTTVESNRTRQLEAENEALRIRLEEAEETLRAIRNNEVDALIVDGPQGQQVFTLQGAEHPYRILMETMSEGALTVAADGTVLYCNSQFSELIGMPLNQIMGASFHDFVMPRNTQSLDGMLRTCGREGCRDEFSLKTADGGEVPVSLSVRVLPLGDMEAFCIVAADLTDQKRAQEALEAARNHLEERVTERTAALSQANATLRREAAERRRAEEALRQSERLYRAIGESINHGVWMCTPDGRNIYASESFLRMVGLTQDEWSSHAWGDVLHPDDVENTLKAWQECVRAGGIWDREVRFRGADGQWHHVLARGIPVRDEEGRITCWAGINLDIDGIKRLEADLRDQQQELERRVQERTAELRKAYDEITQQSQERNELQDQLRQAQKIEALGTLTGGIAHDFNNILAAMIGFAELARDRMKEGSREKQYVSRVFEAGLRGRELIKQMMLFSRKAPHEKKPLHLSNTIKEIMKILRPSMPVTVDIKVKIKEESGMIFADPVQIQQVLMNLATNAGYAMRQSGGTLAIELDDFSVSGNVVSPYGIKPGGYMHLRVADSGEGMTEEVLAKIYDPFFTTKQRGEGTGLGLSVVHGIVNECGGYIVAESRPGEGTSFDLYFPRIAEQVRGRSSPAGMMPTGHERILFIDDEAPLVEMAQEILTELGYGVEVKTSSREALATLRLDPSRFDLVITDQTMPDMTGIELAREVLAIRSDIPMVLCTGFSHAVDETSAKAAGIRAFAMKPLTKREIAVTIRKVLDR